MCSRGASDPIRPADVKEISKRFGERLTKAGIAGASWHVLRHTFASRLLQNGIDIVTGSKLLGHSTIQTTMRYLHLAKTAMREAVNVVSVTQFGTTTTTTTKPGEMVKKVAG
jgi:site-specific recombinase XerD